MVQPSGGLRWPLLAAAEICCCVQVVPPSRETATWRAAGAALPFSWPWNFAQHTYTLPKKGLDAALSAQIWDLSEKVACDCLEMTTGDIHEPLLRMPVGLGLPMPTPAIASKPWKARAVGSWRPGWSSTADRRSP